MLIIENPMPDFSQAELDELFPGGFPGWDVEHASIMETSMMMVIRPGVVRLDKLVDDEAERHPTWDVVPAPDAFVPKTGVLWHATEATLEVGEKFVEAAARRLEEAIRTELGA
jgi:creatinine amidohydrolase